VVPGWHHTSLRTPSEAFARAAVDPVLANPLGAAAVATMLYVDAVSLISR